MIEEMILYAHDKWVEETGAEPSVLILNEHAYRLLADKVSLHIPIEVDATLNYYRGMKVETKPMPWSTDILIDFDGTKNDNPVDDEPKMFTSR